MRLRWSFAAVTVLVACAYRQVDAQSATLYTDNTMDNEFVWFGKGVYPGNPFNWASARGFHHRVW